MQVYILAGFTVFAALIALLFILEGGGFKNEQLRSSHATKAAWTTRIAISLMALSGVYALNAEVQSAIELFVLLVSFVVCVIVLPLLYKRAFHRDRGRTLPEPQPCDR